MGSSTGAWPWQASSATACRLTASSSPGRPSTRSRRRARRSSGTLCPTQPSGKSSLASASSSGGPRSAFDAVPEKLPHWVGLNLYDPFKFYVNVPEEKKQAQLVTEINNGRLAMLGIMGFLSEGKLPGSVPLLKGIIPFYSGEVMSPF